MPSESANYTDSNRQPRASTPGQSRRRQPARPRRPSSAGFTLLAVVVSLVVFFGLWWLLAVSGDEAPLLPAGLVASVVLLVAIAAREVVMRRAWARYTHELEMRMGSEGVQPTPAGLQRPATRKASVRATANSLRALQQRLAQADDAGAQQPAAHLEAFRLCEQYLSSTEETIRASGTAADVRVALRAGQERVRGLQKHHLLSWVRGEAQRYTREAQRRVSVSDKIETAMRALDVINEALQVYPAEPELRDSALAVYNFIATVKVAHWVELAERAAFRGRYTRAVARYRDALFYLSRAQMSEDAREEAANRINREIEMLRARLAVGDLEEEPPLRRRPAKKAKEGERRTG
ncbi:MAG TPA: hypothetical protein VGX24_10555 [Pyrinomonadaceae bacterium]|nr:hypothetical protein [Pyrinomonadaceae bacterium]